MKKRCLAIFEVGSHEERLRLVRLSFHELVICPNSVMSRYGWQRVRWWETLGRNFWEALARVSWKGGPHGIIRGVDPAVLPYV